MFPKQENTNFVSGWAYNELTSVGSARNLAVEVVNTFVSSDQGNGYHDQPKTLAVIDTNAFGVFRSAWEALCAEMTSILQANDDPDFHASLQRARGKAISFMGSLDDPSVTVKAAMDIGSFLAVFQSLCSIDPDSPLSGIFELALSSYNAMFVERQVGPGTPAATGMHISWVTKNEYRTYSDYYDPIIFGETPLILNAPNYAAFLRVFYNTETPSVSGGSVCGVPTAASRPQTDPSELFIDPELSFPVNTTIITSGIVQSVDFVFVEYGMDVSHLLDEDERRLKLLDEVRRRKKRRLTTPQNASSSKMSAFPRNANRRRRAADAKRHTRKAQENEDYLLIYGGDVAVEYAGAEITATWDRNFFFISFQDSLEAAYVYDDYDGLKSIPACYFAPYNPVTPEDIPLLTTSDDAKTTLGCLDAYLTFFTSPNSDGNVGLYVFRDGALSQLSPDAGGQVVPIVYVEFSINGTVVDELLGGFTSTIIPWNNQDTVSIVSIGEDSILELLGSNAGFMQAFAYDDDLQLEDGRYFPYTVGGDDSSGGGGSGVTDGGTDGGDGGGSSAPRISAVTLSLWLILGHVVSLTM